MYYVWKLTNGPIIATDAATIGEDLQSVKILRSSQPGHIAVQRAFFHYTHALKEKLMSLMSLVNFDQGLQKPIQLSVLGTQSLGKIGICRLGRNLRFTSPWWLFVILYGSETWTPYKRDMRYLERFHLQCIWRILGIQWSEKVPNTDVLPKANSQGIESMLVWNQLRWIGHVCRMNNQRIPKQLLYGQLKLGER